jgi:murein DD-endopeptidase MepM/ murein hydrolase activator NlpD
VATPIPTFDLLRGFNFPISGACLPSGEQLFPNAPRAYRNGVHEGVDFYASDNCNRQITRGTQVFAANGGTVVRADLDYHDLIAAQVRLYYGRSDDEALDIFRGRQVWIDHGGGIVSRYCHLDSIAPDIQAGTRVEKGRLIGLVGESGTPESVVSPGSEYHLHFEVRVGDNFLGKGLPHDEVRALYTRLFEP